MDGKISAQDITVPVTTSLRVAMQLERARDVLVPTAFFNLQYCRENIIRSKKNRSPSTDLWPSSHTNKSIYLQVLIAAAKDRNIS